MKKVTQPAKTSYFFGPGWQRLWQFISLFWGFNRDDIRKRAEKVEKGKGIMSISGAFRFLSCIGLLFFGTIFFIIISTAVSVVLGIAFLIVCVLVFLIFVLDRLHLLRKGIFVPCPNCKEKFLIPVYLCPKCGVKHTMLTPGKYGIMNRICNCGQKLPTNFITNRGKLDAECPKCGHPLRGTGNKPICIPIVGGRSAGKTAYITAFSYDFIEKVSPRNGLTISHYNEETKKFYEQEIKNDYSGGTTRMTQTEMDVRQASSKAFSFIVHSSKFSPDRLIQIYDVAGESFIKNSENEVQLQYTYCHGIIFMLDPLSIATVRNYLDDNVSSVDKASLGTIDVDIVLDAFMNKLRELTGESSSSVFTVPIAVVISKSDIRTLDQFIGEDAISDLMTEKGLDMDSYTAAEDFVCRKFLYENGLANFVSNIEMKFKNNRFFKCSAIGHTRERGKYNPRGVLEPMEWIFQTADSGLKSVWHEHSFGDLLKRG